MIPINYLTNVIVFIVCYVIIAITCITVYMMYIRNQRRQGKEIDPHEVAGNAILLVAFPVGIFILIAGFILYGCICILMWAIKKVNNRRI